MLFDQSLVRAAFQWTMLIVWSQPRQRVKSATSEWPQTKAVHSGKRSSMQRLTSTTNTEDSISFPASFGQTDYQKTRLCEFFLSIVQWAQPRQLCDQGSHICLSVSLPIIPKELASSLLMCLMLSAFHVYFRGLTTVVLWDIFCVDSSPALRLKLPIASA